MFTYSKRKIGIIFLSLILTFQLIMAATIIISAEVEYELTYQDPAGDVLKFNETWSNKGSVDSESQIDIKWLKCSNGTINTIDLRLEFKNNQVLEESNETKYVFRVFTSQDNSTGYNITYKNGSASISSFDNSTKEDMTQNTSIIDDKGEVIVVNVNKSKYLDNITYFNIDAFTWKEHDNNTYIDYVSEIPGHPAETGTVVDREDEDSKEEQGFFEGICSLPLFVILVILIVIIIIIVMIWKIRT